jgi:hypothetical protein
MLHSFQRAFHNGKIAHKMTTPNASFVEVLTEWEAIYYAKGSNNSGYSKGVNKLNSLLKKDQSLINLVHEAAITGDHTRLNNAMIKRGHGSINSYLSGYSDFDFYHN